jgi:hypothetical protein
MDFVADFTYRIMHIQELFTHIKSYNEPKEKSCIYAMWHQNQFLVHGIEDKGHLTIQVSTSLDGEIIARVIERMGFKVVRGSAERRGAVQSTMQMISRLKAGESVGIMVDGPRGPLHKVKNGVIKLAQKSGAPIIPAHWYSPQKTFITLPSWDKMKTPLGDCNILNIYGDPIYVSEDATNEEIAKVREDIRNQLLALEEKAPELYKEAVKNKLWKKKNK